MRSAGRRATGAARRRGWVVAAEGVGARVRGRKRAVSGASRRARSDVGRGKPQDLIDMQRTRLLSAAVGVLAEQGYGEFTVGAVCQRSGVSRRTFYDVFENRERCLAAILADAQRRAREALAQLDLDGRAWGERVRMGLWTLLCLADEDPGLARVCLVESLHAGAEIERERGRIAGALADVLDQGRRQGSGASAASRLTAEALVAAVSSVIAARLTQTNSSHTQDGRAGTGGVRGLLGELMGMIVLPYQGPAAARAQIKRALPKDPAFTPTTTVAAGGDPDLLARLPIRLTYRTAQVLAAVVKLTEAGRGASNRQIAESAGISDAGQTSKLLGRLAQHGLLENAVTGSHERGEANQWHLTPTGARVLHSISPRAQPVGARSAA